jgi:short-subunit dehydrogenase
MRTTAVPSALRRAPSSLPWVVKFALGGAVAAAAVYRTQQRRRMNFAGATVLISGGSRGLGLELARAFAEEGANLVLLARDEDALTRTTEELRALGARVLPQVCDIRDPHQVRRSLATIFDEVRDIDVLVNNAGTIQVGPLENMDLSDFESAMNVHFWGPLYLMQEIIPRMKARRNGRIVNIASIGGKVAVPHLLPYAASKFALVGLSEGLRAELIKDSIYVTTVCPGLMRTGSHLNASFKGQHKKEFALFALANASPALSMASARAASQIVEACRYGKAEITLTPQARLLRLVNGVLPSLVSETLGCVSRFLPHPLPTGNDLKNGWESRSRLAPSLLTRPSDRAAERNNEARRLNGARTPQS